MAYSIATAVWAVAGAYVLYNLIQIIQKAYQPGLASVPGPFVASYTNLLLKWQVVRGRRTKYIHALHKQYGPMVRISPNEVAVADLAASRIIHNVKDSFPKGDWYVKIAPFLSEDVTRQGMFGMLDPKPHGVRRRLLSQGFSKSTILKWEEPIKARVRKAVAKIHRDALAGSADVLKWWTLMANDVACELLFGEDFNALGGEKKPPFVKDCEVSMIIGGISAEFKALIPILDRLPIPSLQHAFAVWVKIREACRLGSTASFPLSSSSLTVNLLNLRGLPNSDLIQDRLHIIGQIAIQNTRASTNKTIFSKMATASSSSDSSPTLTLTEAAISQEACNITIAGTDTTAIALTYLVWAVLKHPAVQRKLQAELTEPATSPPPDPLGKDLETLPYLNAVIEETLRLYSPISQSLPRTVPAGGATLAGYALPPGTIVGTQAYTFHRDPAIYPDPLQFNPERWLKPTREMKEAFMAWGAGSRGCIGTHIARLELMHATCMFFRTCGGARLVPATTTDASMAYADFFVIAPYGGKCEIALD